MFACAALKRLDFIVRVIQGPRDRGGDRPLWPFDRLCVDICDVGVNVGLPRQREPRQWRRASARLSHSTLILSRLLHKSTLTTKTPFVRRHLLVDVRTVGLSHSCPADRPSGVQTRYDDDTLCCLGGVM